MISTIRMEGSIQIILVKLIHLISIILVVRGSRNFRQGGGWGPGQSDKKKLLRFFLFFLVLSLFYRGQMVNFKEIYHFSRFQRGSYIFQGGGSNFFQGGVLLLIPYRNPYNL